MKLYLIGGFLGSGKTTAIKNACNALSKAGVKAVVITNDQGEKLVDTAFLQDDNVPVAQVANGCFCCQYTELSAVINRVKEKENPGVIFAEAVGSCTDLIATVAKPLQVQDSGNTLVISVFADALLLFPLLTGNASFLNDDVRYIYKKQLEEADLLVVNKIDVLTAYELSFLKQKMKQQYAAKQLLFQNSFDETQILHWLQAMSSFRLGAERKSLQIDYDTYASGEAAMAWLDEELEIESTGNATELGYQLIDSIEAVVRGRSLVIGHLKFLLDNGTAKQKISFTARPVAETLPAKRLAPAMNLRMLINARVQTTPEQLQQIMSTAINNIAVQNAVYINVKSTAAFRPAYPRPVHRIADK